MAAHGTEVELEALEVHDEGRRKLLYRAPPLRRHALPALLAQVAVVPLSPYTEGGKEGQAGRRREGDVHRGERKERKERRLALVSYFHANDRNPVPSSAVSRNRNYQNSLSEKFGNAHQAFSCLVRPRKSRGLAKTPTHKKEGEDNKL